MTKMNWAAARARDRVAGSGGQSLEWKRRPRLTKTEAKSLAQTARLARGYKGRFGFMIEMSHKAQDPYWVPSDRQAQAIFRCTNPSPRQAGEALPKSG